jgi:molecular chaperone DnaK
MEITFTREQFEELTYDLVERTVTPVENALHDAGLVKSQIDKVLLVGGSTRIPAVQERIRSLMGIEPSGRLNPDECVAMGAAIQGGKLGGQLMPGSTASEILLMDVTPLSLSIETVGGISSRLIERNTAIPTRHSQIFTTAGNFQTSVDIKVFQGERKFTRDNKFLGNFRLSGIKRAFAGTPQIEVTFDIDANGIVNVYAKDLGTGHEQSITITSSSYLSEDEIERAKWEAEIYSRQDKAAGELVEIFKSAKRLITDTQNDLDTNKKTWRRDRKKCTKEALNGLKRTVAKTTPERINPTSAGEIKIAKEHLEGVLLSFAENKDEY